MFPSRNQRRIISSRQSFASLSLSPLLLRITPGRSWDSPPPRLASFSYATRRGFVSFSPSLLYLFLFLSLSLSISGVDAASLFPSLLLFLVLSLASLVFSPPPDSLSCLYLFLVFLIFSCVIILSPPSPIFFHASLLFPFSVSVFCLFPPLCSS